MTQRFRNMDLAAGPVDQLSQSDRVEYLDLRNLDLAAGPVDQLSQSDGVEYLDLSLFHVQQSIVVEF